MKLNEIGRAGRVFARLHLQTLCVTNRIHFWILLDPFGSAARPMLDRHQARRPPGRLPASVRAPTIRQIQYITSPIRQLILPNLNSSI